MKFEFTFDWLAAGSDIPEHAHSTAMLAMHVDNINLMQNQDIWSKSVRDSVLVSAYPLAMWLASSWWRLNWEPLPAHGTRPVVDWRMAHELGAANHGFVWPQVIFASDSEVVQTWSVASNPNRQQSVRYLNGLDKPVSVALIDFQRGIDNFITGVLDRLDAMNCKNTDLFHLWQIIQEDRADPDSEKYRRLEAVMGYDPDGCSQELMAKALKLGDSIGDSAFSELAPVYGNPASQSPLTAIEEIGAASGLIGKPTELRSSKSSPSSGFPWQRAVAAAGEVRQAIGNENGIIDNNNLFDLLGLCVSDVEQWSPAKRNEVSIGVPETQGKYKFLPRKKHPVARRFEFARFLGDLVLAERMSGQWLTSTDLATSRQKYQKAFAAEFLCPISALQEFLDDDYSESSIEDASQHFQVSLMTVNSLLANNGLIQPSWANFDGVRVPYQLGV
jgi:hypothetical protein